MRKYVLPAKMCHGRVLGNGPFFEPPVLVRTLLRLCNFPQRHARLYIPLDLQPLVSSDPLVMHRVVGWETVAHVPARGIFVDMRRQ